MKLQAKRGVVEMGVLARLARGDAYQYQIVACLLSGIDMGEATVYPLLRRMRSEGMVSTYLVEYESGPPRKYYRIEPRGRDVLAQMQAEKRNLFSQIDSIVAGGAA